MAFPFRVNHNVMVAAWQYLAVSLGANALNVTILRIVLGTVF
jgi:hypothetical protein